MICAGHQNLGDEINVEDMGGASNSYGGEVYVLRSGG